MTRRASTRVSEERDGTRTDIHTLFTHVPPSRTPTEKVFELTRPSFSLSASPCSPVPSVKRVYSLPDPSPFTNPTPLPWSSTSCPFHDFSPVLHHGPQGAPTPTHSSLPRLCAQINLSPFDFRRGDFPTDETSSSTPDHLNSHTPTVLSTPVPNLLSPPSYGILSVFQPLGRFTPSLSQTSRSP